MTNVIHPPKGHSEPISFCTYFTFAQIHDRRYPSRAHRTVVVRRSCELYRIQWKGRYVQGSVLGSQGSVLGPILFLIYINDLEDDISSKVLKFADDTKVFRKVTNDTDKQSLQDDLEKCVKW